MYDIIFIIPTIGRKSLKHAVLSLNNLKGNYNWKAIIIFDGIKNNLDYNLINKNYILLEIEKLGKIEKKNNAGLVRNYGIDYIINNEIESEYIAFLDDDDSLNPNYIINLKDEEKIFNFDLIIFRMMYPNYKIVPHQLSNKIMKNNVGISFAVKYKIFKNENIRFINSPFEDFMFINQLKNKIKILISKYVNYFVKTDYEQCSDKIEIYHNILIG